MRCYNGCPDSALKAKWADDARIDKQLAAVGLRAIYFPVEQQWMVFDSEHKPVTDFQGSKGQAAYVAMNERASS
jgi:hypothetical protein